MTSVTAPASLEADIRNIRAKHDADCAAEIRALQKSLADQFKRVMEIAQDKPASAAAPATKAAPKMASRANGPAPVKRTQRRKTKGVMKFRDPEHPELQWSGRGTNPKWFKAGIAAGKTPEYFAIPQS